MVRAVAENQPGINQNRMCSDNSFAAFTARLKGVMAVHPVTGIDSDSHFNTLAMELFSLQSEHNPIYRLLCERSGKTTRTVSHWSEIPTVPTSAFKEWDITSIPTGERSRWFCSSGTTDQRPSRHLHSTASLSIYEHSLWPPFQQHLLPEGCAFGQGLSWISLTPPSHLAPHSSLIHMFSTIRARVEPASFHWCSGVGPSGDWELHSQEVLSALNEACAKQTPVVLLGTAFLFLNLLDAMDAPVTRLHLPPGSRILETGGYKGRTRSVPKAELHSLLCSRLGLPQANIITEYGMAELSSQAYDRICGHKAGTPLHFPPWARARIISPETGVEAMDGEAGLLQIFDLANVHSVLAIQTEDLAVRRGDGFELIGRQPRAEARGCSLMAP